MQLVLVHHGDAVGPDLDPQRPLSAVGRKQVALLAEEAARRGVRPSVIWHSGKLRARQTAEAFRRTCNPFAELSATRDLQPDDLPERMRDRLRGASDDVLIAGHFPHLPRLLGVLIPSGTGAFPPHGIVALTSDDAGATWTEAWTLQGEP